MHSVVTGNVAGRVVGASGEVGVVSRRRTAAIVAGILAACLVVGVLIWAFRAGGGTATSKAGSPSAAPSAALGTAPSAVPATSASGPGPGSVPKTGTSTAPGAGAGGVPGGDAAAGFLNDLGAIDPALVADPGRALRAGQSTCQDLKAHKPREMLIRDTIQRFKAGNVAVTQAKASLIVDAARNNLCPA